MTLNFNSVDLKNNPVFFINSGLVISIADGIVGIKGLQNVANVKWLILLQVVILLQVWF